MTDPAETPAQAKRRRLINLGELIALAALIISGLGLWNGWSGRNDKPAVVVATARSVPLALRGKLEDEGKRLVIAPVESGHALETLMLTAPGKPALDLGSYPYYRPSGNGVSIVAKGTDVAEAEAAIAEVTALMIACGADPVQGEPAS